MNLYLDDDSASRLLARLFVHAGHDVQVPAATDLAGRNDPIHLAHAIAEGRILLTMNYDIGLALDREIFFRQNTLFGNCRHDVSLWLDES